MSSQSIELASLFRDHSHLLKSIIPEQHKVINAIQNCRTDVLGARKLECNSCEYQKYLYNSCRNRHCPKCQTLTKIKWVEKRKEDLLPCEYFHVVFTIPSKLRRLFLQNKRLCYTLLFKATSETLKEVARNPENLGAEIGFIGILHTWSQNLIDHPHIHYVVPSGGLSMDKKKWIKSSDNYFLCVQRLSKVFKGKLLKMLREIYDEEKFTLFGELEELNAPHLFDHFINDLAAINWNVYAKKPFAGPEQVINYLGQYTHRIAISNYRLIKTEGTNVHFKVRDKDNPGKSKVMVLHVKEFLRRFLMHVLPKGFVRMRHFGILGNRYKKENINLIHELLSIIRSLPRSSELTAENLINKLFGIEINSCPKCECGELKHVGDLKNKLSTA